MKKHDKILTIFLITIFISTVIFGANIQKIDNQGNLTPIEGLNNADGELPISYSKFDQNATTIYRLFQSIEFNVNTSEFFEANYAIMRIYFSNSSIENFNMDHVSGTDFTYTFNPRYNNPLGFHNVSFLIYNITNVLLNSPKPITNFTVKTNYLLTLNNTDYSRGKHLYAELIVNDEPAPYDFNWNITVVDSTIESLANNTFNIGNNLQQFTFEIDDRFKFTDKYYYIKINISDTSNGIPEAVYYPFKVINTIPVVNISTVIFSSTTFKRLEDNTVTLNVSDIDFDTSPDDLTVSLILKDPAGGSDTFIMDNTENWNFTTTFSVDTDKPTGTYEVTIDVEDQFGGVGSYTTTLTVINNLPEIHSYTINGFERDESVSINYGDDIIFTFNVSDVEDTLSLITVSLINEDDDWYNITQPYRENMEFVIRTEELLEGVWYVYLTVTDEDLGTTYLTSDFGFGPQEIRIIPDILSPVLSWITFFIGILLGLLVGIGILYNLFRKRFDTPLTEKKAKKVAPKKEVKKPKKEPIKPEPEKPKKTEIKEEKEEPKQQPQRKIKRKL